MTASTRRTVLRATAIVVAAVALVCVTGFAWLKLAPRYVPEGQLPLATLEPGSLPAFRATFNASAGEVRILALLSPT